MVPIGKVRLFILDALFENILIFPSRFEFFIFEFLFFSYWQYVWERGCIFLHKLRLLLYYDQLWVLTTSLSDLLSQSQYFRQ